MKRPWAIALFLAWGGIALAQAPKDAPPPPRDGASPATGKAAPAVAYKPPARGAPQRRVGGASRGASGTAPAVAVLVPDHVGLTLEEQPDLYWFISRPSPVRIELTLIDGKGTVPVKEVVLKGAASAGIHRFSLREQGVKLVPGTDYEWSVAVVPDPDSRSADILAGGALRRVATDATLAAKLRGVTGTSRASVLADAGIWYDALAALSAQIEAKPGDGASRTARAELLDQVGLKEVAAFERR